MPKDIDWKKIAIPALISLFVGLIAFGADISGRVKTLEEIIRRIDVSLLQLREDIKELR